MKEKFRYFRVGVTLALIFVGVASTRASVEADNSPARTSIGLVGEGCDSDMNGTERQRAELLMLNPTYAIAMQCWPYAKSASVLQIVPWPLEQLNLADALSSRIRRMEEMFGVDFYLAEEDSIIGLGQKPEKLPKQVTAFLDRADYNAISWDSESVDDMERLLTNIPDSLYRIDSRQKPLLVLVEQKKDKDRTVKYAGHCLCKNLIGQEPSHPPVVVINRSYIRQQASNPEQRIQKWAHEFSHIAHGDLDEIRASLAVLGITTANDDELVFQNLQLMNILETSGHLNYDEDEGKIKADELGFAAMFPREWIALGVENYILGRDYFLEYYGQAVGEEGAREYYGFLRERLFSGKEFPPGLFAKARLDN